MIHLPTYSPIENLDLIAKQVVEGFIIGLHKSPFHGFSVEFAEHRIYNNGDNLKHVDWKVYGRKDRMFVKKFEEETNLRCCIAMDTSGSMYYPETGKISKLQYSCIAAASLLYLFKKQLDAGSLALFDESLYFLSTARSGQRHYKQLINELELLLHSSNTNKITQAPNALHQIADRLHQRSLVIIFSDMPGDIDEKDELLSSLKHLKYNKHEVILFHVVDGDQEMNFEFENRPYEFVDMESKVIVKLNPEEVKEEYLFKMNAYRKKLQDHCIQYGIDLVTCDLKEPVEQVLRRYMLKRNKMM